MSEGPLPRASPRGAEPPPPGVRVMAAVRWAILALTALLAIGSWWSYARAKLAPDAGDHAPKYRCPMHPQIVSDEPGECPICHMTLEPIANAGASATPVAVVDAGAPDGASTTATSVTYTCPMHPQVHEHAPGKCPICGMPLVPETPDAGVTATLPPGTTPIVLAFDRIQSIGVRTAVAMEKRAADALRVTATIAPADQAISEVHLRSAGFIERIPVDQVGTGVARDQELLAVYSPEVFQAQTELLAARGWSDGGASPTTGAARRKLELLGVASEDVDRILASGVALRAVPVRAPSSGIVTKKTAVRGGYATPETALYEIEDLSRVYVIADVFQGDVPLVRVGERARFTLRGRPDVAVDGTIDLLYPQVDAEARTTRARMTVRNPHGVLRPGDYGDVEITTPPREALAIPRDAVVDTGETKYVFVVEDGGRFTPRIVDVASMTASDAIVRSGLQPGERVVSGATFLIDSESRLEASMTHAATDAGAP